MLRRLYYFATIQIKTLIGRIIRLCYDVLVYHADNVRNPTLRKAVETVVATIANTCELILQLPRQDVVRITGSTGSVVYVGEEDGHTLKLLELLFPEGYEISNLGRVILWKLPAQTQAWLQENDLLICRVSQFFPWRIPATYAFDSPLQVAQIVTFEKPLDEMLTGRGKRSLRAKINKILKQNYTYRISRSPQDLEFFYHRMMVPTAQQRHQHRAMIPPYQYFEDLLKFGCLVFLCLDGKEIAATINYARDNVFRGRYLGFLDGNTELLKREVHTAMYWYSIEHAYNQGLQRMSFESSFACTGNGVFDYKSRWGAKVYHDPSERIQLLFRAERLSVEWQERLNDIGFITRHKNQHLRVFIDQITPSPDDARDQAMRHGLDGIQVVTPHQHHNHLSDAPQALSKQTG